MEDDDFSSDADNINHDELLDTDGEPLTYFRGIVEDFKPNFNKSWYTPLDDSKCKHYFQQI